MIGEGADIGAEAARRLADLGCCAVDPGLTDAEFVRIEREYGFTFADDHRAFLAAGLPVNRVEPVPEGVILTWDRPWPDWRDGDPAELRRRLDWPIEGALFDVEHNRLWSAEWGERPADVADALAIAGRALADVPTMVPVYAHRYLPGGAGTFGHPVLSMYQTDIIYYGLDLVDYVHQEFGGPGMDRDDERWRPESTVPFWSDFL